MFKKLKQDSDESMEKNRERDETKSNLSSGTLVKLEMKSKQDLIKIIKKLSKRANLLNQSEEKIKILKLENEELKNSKNNCKISNFNTTDLVNQLTSIKNEEIKPSTKEGIDILHETIKLVQCRNFQTCPDAIQNCLNTVKKWCQCLSKSMGIEIPNFRENTIENMDILQKSFENMNNLVNDLVFITNESANSSDLSIEEKTKYNNLMDYINFIKNIKLIMASTSSRNEGSVGEFESDQLKDDNAVVRCSVTLRDVATTLGVETLNNYLEKQYVLMMESHQSEMDILANTVTSLNIKIENNKNKQNVVSNDVNMQLNFDHFKTIFHDFNEKVCSNVDYLLQLIKENKNLNESEKMNFNKQLDFIIKVRQDLMYYLNLNLNDTHNVDFISQNLYNFFKIIFECLNDIQKIFLNVINSSLQLSCINNFKCTLQTMHQTQKLIVDDILLFKTDFCQHVQLMQEFCPKLKKNSSEIGKINKNCIKFIKMYKIDNYNLITKNVSNEKKLKNSEFLKSKIETFELKNKEFKQEIDSFKIICADYKKKLHKSKQDETSLDEKISKLTKTLQNKNKKVELYKIKFNNCLKILINFEKNFNILLSQKEQFFSEKVCRFLKIVNSVELHVLKFKNIQKYIHLLKLDQKIKTLIRIIDRYPIILNNVMENNFNLILESGSTSIESPVELDTLNYPPKNVISTLFDNTDNVQFIKLCQSIFFSFNAFFHLFNIFMQNFNLLVLNTHEKYHLLFNALEVKVLYIQSLSNVTNLQVLPHINFIKSNLSYAIENEEKLKNGFKNVQSELVSQQNQFHSLIQDKELQYRANMKSLGIEFENHLAIIENDHNTTLEEFKEAEKENIKEAISRLNSELKLARSHVIELESHSNDLVDQSQNDVKNLKGNYLNEKRKLEKRILDLRKMKDDLMKIYEATTQKLNKELDESKKIIQDFKNKDGLSHIQVEYLKATVMKYMMGQKNRALVSVILTILKFTQNESDIIFRHMYDL